MTHASTRRTPRMARTKPTPPVPDEPLAAKLRRLVEKRRKGRRDDQIAADAGIPATTLSKLVNGHAKNPRYETLMAVLKALDATLCDLDRA